LRHLWWTRGAEVEGREWLERVLAEADQASSAARGDALRAVGILARRQGDLEQALAYEEQALAIHRSLADERGVASALSNLIAIAIGMSWTARWPWPSKRGRRRPGAERSGWAASRSTISPG
jgi:tetratricopeptide (TPR) repeat protein